MMLLFGFRYFAPKWQKIPVGVYPRLMQNGNPARFYLGNQKSFHPDMAITSSHNDPSVDTSSHIIISKSDKFCLKKLDLDITTILPSFVHFQYNLLYILEHYRQE